MATSGGKKKRKTIDTLFPAMEQTPKAKKQTPTIEENPPANVDVSTHTTTPPLETHSPSNIDIVVGSLQRDPIKRIPIWKRHVNQMDEIRRAYIKMRPYQPMLLDYPETKYGSQNRRFQKSWFNKFPWLEYFDSVDKVFCFPCFLFESKSSRYPTFTTSGFNAWKRVNNGENCPLLTHIGGPTSFHNNAVNSMLGLMNVNRHVGIVLNVQNLEEKVKQRLRLTMTIISILYLTMQACALRGNDESASSSNRGNFKELVKVMGEINPSINAVILEKAPKNAPYTSSDIQKDVLRTFANQVRSKIREEVGDAKFCILVDEAKDQSDKEQMAIVLRHVDIKGFLRECFFEIACVSDTAATTLKKVISSVLSEYNLHICNMRGQGYDGASNMSGSWNGLQALFLRESPYAYYVHCFAHRLQLALVATAIKEPYVYLFFSRLNCIINLVRSPKCQGELQSAHAIDVQNMIATGERDTGRGANQICNLQRAGKTRWSSHFDSICSLTDMFGAVITVLKNLTREGSTRSIRGDC